MFFKCEGNSSHCQQKTFHPNSLCETKFGWWRHSPLSHTHGNHSFLRRNAFSKLWKNGFIKVSTKFLILRMRMRIYSWTYIVWYYKYCLMLRVEDKQKSKTFLELQKLIGALVMISWKEKKNWRNTIKKCTMILLKDYFSILSPVWLQSRNTINSYLIQCFQVFYLSKFQQYIVNIQINPRIISITNLSCRWFTTQTTLLYYLQWFPTAVGADIGDRNGVADSA